MVIFQVKILKKIKNKIKNNIKFISSMVIFLIYTLTYIINLHPNCNKQNRTNCLLPNWFNHNALLHLFYSISYILVNLHIIEIE